MIIAYFGRGKGKTSACVGQTIRALGSGLTVAFGQFMKRPGKAGEQEFLRNLLGDDFYAAGAGFFRQSRQFAVQREKALEVLAWASARSSSMLVLDEVLLALDRGLLTQADLEPYLTATNSPTRHLVVSGPKLPEWFFNCCDIATEMRKMIHAHDKGVQAIRGIEY